MITQQEKEEMIQIAQETEELENYLKENFVRYLDEQWGSQKFADVRFINWGDTVEFEIGEDSSALQLKAYVIKILPTDTRELVLQKLKDFVRAQTLLLLESSGFKITLDSILKYEKRPVKIVFEDIILRNSENLVKKPDICAIKIGFGMVYS